MKFLITFVFLAAFSTLSLAGPSPVPLIPDPRYTGGQICSVGDRDFSTFRYSEHIPYCERNVASSLKKKIYSQYRIHEKCRADYTIDHFYPLSLGGNNAELNLWPEHKAIKQIRQNLEQRLYRALSEGKVSQAAALAEIQAAKLNPDSSKILPGSYCDQFAPTARLY